MTQTRESLIDLCARGVVNVEKWHNRDSADAQRQLGEAQALLRSGCNFRFSNDPASTEKTVRDELAAWDDELFYIPTDERLAAAQGGDWY